jgi:hypothetical protein
MLLQPPLLQVPQVECINIIHRFLPSCHFLTGWLFAFYNIFLLVFIVDREG